MFYAPLQPGDAECIHQADPQPVRHAVMGLPPGAGTVVDLNGNRFTALAQKKGWQETVHMVEIGQFQKSGTVKELDATACIRSRILEDKLPKAIGNARRKLFYQRVLPAAAVSADHQVLSRTRLRGTDPQFWNISRIVLAVSIQGDYPG